MRVPSQFLNIAISNDDLLSNSDGEQAVGGMAHGFESLRSCSRRYMVHSSTSDIAVHSIA